jgi:TolA-binding protein
MPSEILELIKFVLPSVLTGLGGVLFGRARRKAELESLIQKNKDSEFDRLHEVVNELQEQNREYRATFRDQQAEIRELKAEIRSIQESNAKERQDYQEQIRLLQQENAGLKLRIEKLEKENSALKEGGIIPKASPSKGE